jgi:DNA-binding response OmpR family regulator
VESLYPTQLHLSFNDAARLLVVEDDRDTLEMLAVYFSAQGYFVATAKTGKEALEAASHKPGFDVVLLDLFIPDIGGLEVLAGITRQSDGPSVILLTALADKEIAHEAHELGAFDYILKPYNLEQVESSVVACIAHREYMKQSWWKRIAS